LLKSWARGLPNSQAADLRSRAPQWLTILMLTFLI
jgi:hypothetical protein